MLKTIKINIDVKNSSMTSEIRSLKDCSFLHCLCLSVCLSHSLRRVQLLYWSCQMGGGRVHTAKNCGLLPSAMRGSLEVDFSAPVKPSDDLSPANTLATTQEKP